MADRGTTFGPARPILVSGADILAAGLAGWAAGPAGMGFRLRGLDVRSVLLWLLGRFAPARGQASAVSDRFPR